MNTTFNLPAIKGYQAENEFFSIVCTLNLLCKLFDITNNHISEDFKAQRKLNERRIPEIANYILNNPSNYIFSSITASMDGAYIFTPISDDPSIGLLKLDESSHLLINDGQHRKAAIEKALEIKPELEKEQISIILYIDRDLKSCQQMFSDLNRNAVKVSKSNALLYNHRDPEIALMKKYLAKNKCLDQYLDKSHDSIAQKSNKLFTYSNFFKAFRISYGCKPEILTNCKMQSFITDYWDYLTQHFTEWTPIINGELHASQARKNSVAAYGIILEALGKLCFDLYNQNIKDWKNFLNCLNDIDWSKTNSKDWLNRCIIENGTIHKSSTYIERSYLHIKKLIGLPLTETEITEEINLEKDCVNAN